MADSLPPVLLESWLPLAEIEVESRRERAASSALPPLFTSFTSGGTGGRR